MTRQTRALRGLIFDLDGTLIDSNEIHAKAWQLAFVQFGKNLPIGEIREHMGKGGDLLVPDLLNGREMQRFGKELTDYRRDLFRKDFIDQIRPFPGIHSCFTRLRDLGIKLVLASSSDKKEVKHFIDLLGIKDLIEAATSKEDAEFSKPSPEIFEAAVKEISLPLINLMTVGDTPYDILASHRASLPIAAVLSGGFDRHILQKAEFLFADVEELTRRVEELESWLASDRDKP